MNLCITMFKTLEGVLHKLTNWCFENPVGFQVATILFLFILIYMSIILISKIVNMPWINRDNQYKTLCEAIINNSTITAMKILTKHPEYINMADNHTTYTPFLLACGNSNTQLVSYMIKHGADIKKKSGFNESPFYIACFYYVKHPRCTNASCIRELYYAGANINEPNDKGLTPLQMAAMFGHTALVKWLLVKKAVTDLYPHPYLIAMSQGHQETASLILKTRTPELCWK